MFRTEAVGADQCQQQTERMTHVLLRLQRGQVLDNKMAMWGLPIGRGY